jgi:hypothetical protein
VGGPAPSERCRPTLALTIEPPEVDGWNLLMETSFCLSPADFIARLLLGFGLDQTLHVIGLRGEPGASDDD